MSYDEENFPNLPASWNIVTVEDACSNLSVTQKVPMKSYLAAGSLPVVDQGAALIGGYTDDDIAVTEQLPVVVFGDHTRALKYIDFRFAAGADGIKVLAPNELFLPRAFFRFVQGTRLPDRGYARHFQYLRKSTLPLPPLNEQKRIADKLDAILARVDACRDRLDRFSAILKLFRQSVLAAATSGKLTEDWRADQVARMQPQAESGNTARDSAQLRYAATAVPDFAALRPGYGTDDEIDGWTITDVQTVAQVGTGSTPLRSNQAFFAAMGTPWVTSAATAKPIILAADEFVTDAAIVAHRLKKFPAGTLLVAMYGEGKTRGQVSELGIDATVNQACAAVVVDEERAKKAFVKLALQANYLEMRELAEGGNQPNLNLSKIKEFPLRLPSRDEQTEIIRRVETLFAYADRLEARYKAARAQVEKLTPATLAKAFRGGLVPQDPNDEPASALLERIRAQRGEHTTTKPKRGRKAITA